MKDQLICSQVLKRPGINQFAIAVTTIASANARVGTTRNHHLCRRRRWFLFPHCFLLLDLPALQVLVPKVVAAALHDEVHATILCQRRPREEAAVHTQGCVIRYIRTVEPKSPPIECRRIHRLHFSKVPLLCRRYLVEVPPLLKIWFRLNQAG